MSAEPLRERGYRLLIETLAASGKAAAALRTYEQLRVTLRDELGITPSAAIRVVHEQLLAGGDPSRHIGVWFSSRTDSCSRSASRRTRSPQPEPAVGRQRRVMERIGGEAALNRQDPR